MSVSLCDKGVIFLSDGDIQEVDLVVRKFRCEFNGSVERVDMVKEGVNAVFFSGPDDKHIVNVPPPYPWTTWATSNISALQA